MTGGKSGNVERRTGYPPRPRAQASGHSGGWATDGRADAEAATPRVAVLVDVVSASGAGGGRRGRAQASGGCWPVRVLVVDRFLFSPGRGGGHRLV